MGEPEWLRFAALLCHLSLGWAGLNLGREYFSLAVRYGSGPPPPLGLAGWVGELLCFFVFLTFTF